MKKTVCVIAALALVFCLSACGGSAQPQGNAPPAPPAGTTTPGTPATSTPPPAAPMDTTPVGPEGQSYGGVVKMATAADIATPYGNVWLTGVNYSNTLVIPFAETLVLETTGGVIHPWLAKSWEIDAEKEEVRLALRDDVNFSDGSKFNAAVVEWWFVEARQGASINPAIGEVEASGEYEVTIHMGNGFSNMILNLIGTHSYGMCSMENVLKNGLDYAGLNPVGTGAFVQTEKIPGSRIIYSRRDDYWQPERPFLDRFEYHALTDVMTQNAALQAYDSPDRIDILSSTNGEQLALLDADPYLSVVASQSGVNALYPSSRNEDSPFADQRVREAVSYAIDRDAISQARGFGFLDPAKQIIAKNFFGYFDDGRNYYSYDPAKARALLSEAGYPNGFSTNYVASGASDRDIAVAVQAMLADVGIQCEIEFPEVARYNEIRGAGWEGLYYGAFTSLASVPSTFRLQADPDYRYYTSTWRPEEMREDFFALQQTLSFDNTIAQRLHSYLTDNMCIIPVLENISAYVVRDSVKGGEFGSWGSGTQFLSESLWLDE